MKSVLISGITGFVGENLKIYLKDNWKTIGLSRNSNENASIYTYEDVEGLLNNSFAFVHLAGKAHDLKKTSEETEYFEINYELTKMLLDKFLASSCEVFIYMSSVKAVADSVMGHLSEDNIPDPSTAYGKSKLAAEEYIRSKEVYGNKRIYILRPCMIHGPGNKGNLNLLYNVVSKGIPYPLAGFENKRSFLSVENLCFVINAILNRNDVPSGVYNVSDDEVLSTNQLVKLIGETTGKQARFWKLPQSLITNLAKIGDLLHLPLTSERLNKLTESYIVNNSKIKLALKVDLPIAAEEGIRKTISSFSSIKK